jgi:hypothetical protein
VLIYEFGGDIIRNCAKCLRRCDVAFPHDPQAPAKGAQYIIGPLIPAAAQGDKGPSYQAEGQVAVTQPIADDYRRQVEECRLQASKSWRDEDKAAWLKMAADWQRLAEGVEAKAPGSRTQENEADQTAQQRSTGRLEG